MKLGNGLGSLHLVCRKCTREAHIAAPTMEVAVELAKLRGWVAEGESYVCPRCPTFRPDPKHPDKRDSDQWRKASAVEVAA